MWRWTALLMAGIALGCSGGDDENAASDPAGVAERARESGGPLAERRTDETDRETMRTIRHTLAADESLSDSARSIDVKAVDGVVTLTGAVESEGEREVVSSIARSIAGEANVVDRLDVVPPAGGDSSERAD